MSSTTEIPASQWQINRGPEMVQHATPVIVLTTLVVSLRLAMTLSRRTGMGYDGWLILLSLILLWTFYTFVMVLVSMAGLGRPLVVNLAIDPNRLVLCLKIMFAAQFVFMTMIVAIKFSILAFYIRLFPTKFICVSSYIVAGMLTAWWLAVLLVSIFMCYPVQKSWSPNMTTGYCIDQVKLYDSMIIPNIITDLFVFCLPVVEVRKLHMPRSQRIGLASVFLLGTGAIASSIIRLWYNLQLAIEGEDDLTMAIFDSVLWTFLEPAIGILAACLPTMRLVLLRLTTAPVFQKISLYFANSKSAESSEDDHKEYALVENRTIGGGIIPNRVKNNKIKDGSIQELKTFAEEQTTNVSEYGGRGGSHEDGLEEPCPVDHSGFDPYEVCPECAVRNQARGPSMC